MKSPIIENADVSSKKNTGSASKFIILILAIAFFVALGYAVYYHNQLANLQNPSQASSVANAQAVQAIVAKVGQLIVLPQNEIPTVATVTDPSALKNQPFFKNAQKGDEVLVYTTAQKAILYDPNLNKIVEVAPLTTSAPQIAPQSTSTKS